VCPNCALMSKDYNNCEFCKKVLPDDCKMFDPVKAKDEERQRKKELQLKVQKEKLLIAKLVCKFQSIEMFCLLPG